MSDDKEYDASLSRRKQYKPGELPEEITRTIFIGYGIGKYNAGMIVLEDKELEGEDFATVRLVSKKMTFKLPKVEIDIKGKMLKVLEEEKKKIMAENHQRLQEVQERIDQLLAIEYKPAGDSEEQ